MGIDYSKTGLRLGYLIRGKYHTAAGVEGTLRLCGPASRVGTGLAVVDPDASAPATRHYWRAGSSDPTLVEDIGKLDQHIATLNKLKLTVRLDYPRNADSAVADSSNDGDLRAAAVGGRWANRPVDLWFIDIDTGDTDHRMRAAWDRNAQNVRAGAFTLSAIETPTELFESWKMTTMPFSTTSYVDNGGTVNSASMFVAPTTSGGGGGFGIPRGSWGAKIGCVFGTDTVTGGLPAAPIWRQCAVYGDTIGTGTGSPAYGNATDAVFWIHVSPQFGCGVGVVRLVGDDGVAMETNQYRDNVANPTHFVQLPLTGHNHDPTRGPIGTFCIVQMGTVAAANFTPQTNSNAVYARIHGPSSSPLSLEYHATYGAPYTSVAGYGTQPSVMHAADLIELLIEGSDYYNDTTILGTTAVADFKALVPAGAAAGYPQYLCAVPQHVASDTSITYRDVLGQLVAGLPGDLIYRIDPTVGQRRLFPWWRRPRPNEAPDWTIRPSDLVSLSPIPTVRQDDDPDGEYANEVAVQAPKYIDQPTVFPVVPTDALERTSANGLRIADLAEQSLTTGAAAVVARDRSWLYWSPLDSTSGKAHSGYLAAEVSQPQTWTEADLGGRWMRLQLGDTVRYQIHGVTSAPGMVRRLEYALESQTITAVAVHVVEYEAGAGGGD